MEHLPSLNRCRSLPLQTPAGDGGAAGPSDDLDGWRRARDWLAWAGAAQRALCRPGRPVSPSRAYDLAAPAPAELFWVDEVEPLTLGTFREHLDARLAAGRPAWLAQMTTPLPEVRAFHHMFAGVPYAAHAAQQRRDVTDLEVANPCSRQSATRLVLVLWDRCAESFRPFFDSRYTAPGSFVDAAAQAIVGIAAEGLSHGAWAVLGWTLRLPELGLAPPDSGTPASPRPRRGAARLRRQSRRPCPRPPRPGDLADARHPRGGRRVVGRHRRPRDPRGDRAAGHRRLCARRRPGCRLPLGAGEASRRPRRAVEGTDLSLTSAALWSAPLPNVQSFYFGRKGWPVQQLAPRLR